MDKNQFAGKKIAILGFGLEGKSTLNFLLNHHFAFDQITVLDMNPQAIPIPGVAQKSGQDYLSTLSDYDVIFKSAGVPYTPELLQHKEKILTQMQFFFDNYAGKVIAITASKGKTTMTSLLFQILKNAGLKVKLVGNIGNPVLDEIDFDQEYDYVVAELSSYMLEHLDKKNTISVLWSMFPEHMDWHGSLEKYFNAKLNILKGSETNFVLEKTVKEFWLDAHYSNIQTFGIGGRTSRDHGYFTHDLQELFPTSDRKLIWDHNLQNISLAIAVSIFLKIPMEIIHQAILDFEGVPHRLQYVGEQKGIRFYDDAISTTPDSTIEALKALDGQIGTIFLGGTDRGYDFSLLMQKIQESWIQNIVFFPPSGSTMLKLLSKTSLRVLQTSDMAEAVAFAYKYTPEGKVCLLSTASPSYSIWKNFEEKGTLFQQEILRQAQL